MVETPPFIPPGAESSEIGIERENSESKKPWQMTYEQFLTEYERVMTSVAAKEKKGRLDPSAQPYEPLTEEEQELHARDWKEFSRRRGYSEEDIKEYERWFLLSGQADNLPGAINDPWRRSRPNWAESLWKKHIERALAAGHSVSDNIKSEYEQKLAGTSSFPR